MKPYNKMTPKEKALKFIYSYDNIGRFRRKPRLDMRFNESKEIAKWINLLQITEEERARIYNLRVLRSKRRIHGNPSPNWLNRPITIDAINNKASIKYIRPDHIHFWGNRKHWAKDAQDIKILQILKKYRTVNR